MKANLTILLAAAGVSPLASASTSIAVVDQQGTSINAQTAEIVRELIGIGAIYANADATKLMIKSQCLSAEVYEKIRDSSRANIDLSSGDFVIDENFAAALAKSSTLNEEMPQTVQDYLLLLKLKQQSDETLKNETLAFRANPFFS